MNTSKANNPWSEERLLELARWLQPRVRPGLMVEEEAGLRPLKMMEAQALFLAKRREDDGANDGV